MPRTCNSATSAGSGVPTNVDELIIVTDVGDLPQSIQENMVADLAPSDVDSRLVDFESIANNTIILHELPVTSDRNHLFNSPNLGPMISPVLQL